MNLTLLLVAFIYFGIGAFGIYQMLGEVVGAKILAELVGDMPILGLFVAWLIWPATFILVGFIAVNRHME